MAKVIKKFPRLYSVSKTGKITTTKLTVEKRNNCCVIVNEHGYVDGSKQYDYREVRSGKNIGRSNETTVEEQAILKAKSKWNKKIDSNYTTNKNGIPSGGEMSLLPMLANRFDKASHRISYPCLVQPKLDGLRAIAKVNSKVKFTSRKFKPYNSLGHLASQMKKLFGNLDVPIDGECYLHGLTLEEINRRVRKYAEGDTEAIEFWVFDIVDKRLDNDARNEILKKVFKKGNSPNVKMVPTYVAHSKKDVLKFHDQFVAEGFEGIIIRNMDGKYLLGKRSSDLQKLKNFLDDEFKIVGITSGEGREKNAIIYTCQVKRAKKQKTFEVRPRGSIEMRRKLMKKGAKYFIGKKLTVRYQTLTELNVPQFPVGIIVRDD